MNIVDRTALATVCRLDSDLNNMYATDPRDIASPKDKLSRNLEMKHKHIAGKT